MSNETKKCPFCNETINASEKVCPICCEELPVEDSSKEFRCPYCNEIIDSKDEICPICCETLTSFNPKENIEDNDTKNENTDTEGFVNDNHDEKYNCPFCNEIIDKNSTVCEYCGESFSSDIDSNYTNIEIKPSNTYDKQIDKYTEFMKRVGNNHPEKKAYIILGIVLLLIIMMIPFNNHLNKNQFNLHTTLKNGIPADISLEYDYKNNLSTITVTEPKIFIEEWQEDYFSHLKELESELHLVADGTSGNQIYDYHGMSSQKNEPISVTFLIDTKSKKEFDAIKNQVITNAKNNTIELILPDFLGTNEKIKQKYKNQYVARRIKH